VTAARVGPAEELDPRNVLQQLVDFVTWGLLDLPLTDVLNGVGLLGFRLGQRRAGDDDLRLRRKGRDRLKQTRLWSLARGLERHESPKQRP
jgi:hypothetical protein